MEYQKKKRSFILLEDGSLFYGNSIGIEGTSFGEICFNTSMTGYQEVFTDPSYYSQIMVMTNAHIGNYGVIENEEQSKEIKISGLICRNLNSNFSRPLAKISLIDYFKKQQKIIIADVDTRSLVRHIRKSGTMNAAISTEIKNQEKIAKELSLVPPMEGLELASKVSTKIPYFFGDPKSKHKIAVIDIGVKKSILEHLAACDFYLKVFPYNVVFEKTEKWKPDGYFISNGPGDPQTLKEIQFLIKKIIKKNKPLFGICLGHQVIALANGIPTYKMHNGHRGINHPIIHINKNKGEITSQNHGFSVSRKNLNENIIVTHTHLNDNTIAGIEMKNKPVFSVQYHPEAHPGPNDSKYLFKLFKEKIEKVKNNTT